MVPSLVGPPTRGCRPLRCASDGIDRYAAFGRFEGALVQFNSLQEGRLLTCKQILERYDDNARAALRQIRDGHGGLPLGRTVRQRTQIREPLLPRGPGALVSRVSSPGRG